MFPGMGKTTLGWEPQTQSILTGGRPSYNFPYMPPSCHKLLNTLTNHIMPPTILPTASWTGKALWVLESGLDSSNFNCSLIYVVFKSRVPVLQSLHMLWHICLPRMSTNRNPSWKHLTTCPSLHPPHYKHSYLSKIGWILYHFLKNLNITPIISTYPFFF